MIRNVRQTNTLHIIIVVTKYINLYIYFNFVVKLFSSVFVDNKFRRSNTFYIIIKIYGCFILKHILDLFFLNSSPIFYRIKVTHKRETRTFLKQTIFWYFIVLKLINNNAFNDLFNIVDMISILYLKPLWLFSDWVLNK